MATHSDIHTGEFPWTEEPGLLSSMGLQGVGHDWVTDTLTFFHFLSLECACFLNKPFFCLPGSLVNSFLCEESPHVVAVPGAQTGPPSCPAPPVLHLDGHLQIFSRLPPSPSSCWLRNQLSWDWQVNYDSTIILPVPKFFWCHFFFQYLSAGGLTLFKKCIHYHFSGFTGGTETLLSVVWHSSRTESVCGLYWWLLKCLPFSPPEIH